jgi:hypothetical protein
MVFMDDDFPSNISNIRQVWRSLSISSLLNPESADAKWQIFAGFNHQNNHQNIIKSDDLTIFDGYFIGEFHKNSWQLAL